MESRGHRCNTDLWAAKVRRRRSNSVGAEADDGVAENEGHPFHPAEGSTIPAVGKWSSIRSPTYTFGPRACGCDANMDVCYEPWKTAIFPGAARPSSRFIMSL